MLQQFLIATTLALVVCLPLVDREGMPGRRIGGGTRHALLVS